MISTRFVASIAALLVSTFPICAQTWTEVGDAGQTLAGVQNTGVVGGNSLTTIFGTLSSATDADLFRITITAPTTFSASTVNMTTATSMLDTVLFLFTSNGLAICMNDDDASGLVTQSRIPAGNSFTMVLSPGVYILGISLSDNEPVNSSNQLLFAAGDSTSVRGPASGINPTTLFDFTGGGFPPTGSYQIDLTSAASAVPEPSTLILASGGALGLIALLRRRAGRASV
ncbi:MAG: DVUA0089 family protein [Chthoniobacterales bacterium]